MRLLRLFVVCVLGLFLVSPVVWGQSIITLDPSNAGTGTYQGTFPNAINPAGTVVGFTRDQY